MATDAQILGAATSALQTIGLTRATADDIARLAGVNRTTLYRRFGSMENLVRAAVLHEVSATIEEINERVLDVPSYEELFSTGVARTVLLLREHPLLQRILTTDREASLPAVTVEAGPLLEAGTATMLSNVRVLQERHGVAGRATDEASCAVSVRLIHSLVITADGPPTLTTEEDLAEFGRTFVAPLFL